MNDIKELIEEAHVCVGKGWWPIIDKYLPQIVELAPDCNINMKEKFGLLRIQCYGQMIDAEKVRALQEEAYIASSTVCEECGAPGRLHTEFYWRQTLCDRCAAKLHKK